MAHAIHAAKADESQHQNEETWKRLGDAARVILERVEAKRREREAGE